MARAKTRDAEMGDFKVDVVGIGFPKCGTTWVANMLAQHPEVDFAKDKEPHYFFADSLIAGNSPLKVGSLAEYKGQFDNDGRLRAEFSVDYLYSDGLAKRLLDHNPKVKVLICTRDRADFMNSYFWFDKSSMRGHEMASNLDDQLLYKENSIGQTLIQRSKFGLYVDKFLKNFPASQVMLIEHKSIKDNPKELLSSLWNFLGISSFSPQGINEKVNTSMAIRSVKSAQVINFTFGLLQRVGMSKVTFWLMRNKSIRSLYEKFFKKKFSKPALSPATIDLINSTLEDDVKLLKTTLGKHGLL